MSDADLDGTRPARTIQLGPRAIFGSGLLLGLLAGALVSVLLTGSSDDGAPVASPSHDDVADGLGDLTGPDDDLQEHDPGDATLDTDAGTDTNSEDAASDELMASDDAGEVADVDESGQEPEEATGPDGWRLSMDDPSEWYEAHTGPRGLDESAFESYEGRLDVEEAGAVIEDLIVDGPLHVLADNVVLRNVVVNGVLNLRDSDGALIEDVIVRSTAPYPVNAGEATGWTLQYAEIDGLESPHNNGGLSGGNGTVRYSEFHSHTDSAKVGSNSVWEYNWLHSNGTWGTDAHVDGLQSTGATNVLVRRNLIDMPIDDGANSAIIAQSNFGSIEDWTVEENYLNGGNYTVYFREKGNGNPKNVAVHNNRIGRDYRHGLFSIDGDVAVHGNFYRDPIEPANR